MSEDPYYYPGTDVLKNLKNIRDKKELERFETGSAQLRSIAAEKLSGLFDINRLNATHQALFGKVYEWAGKFRENTGTMTKGREAGYNVTYGNSSHVPSQLAIVFAELKKENYLKDLPVEQFAKRLAHFYGEIDAVHPYRDGNSRTLRLFTTDLAKEAGHSLDWDRTLHTDADRNKLFQARDLAVMRADSSELAGVVLTCLTERVQERNVPSPEAEDNTMPDLEVASNTQQISSHQSTQEETDIANGPAPAKADATYIAQYLTRSEHLEITEIESDEWVDIAGGEQQLRVQTGKDEGW
ncbi:Fic/DOC family protein [Edaphobacter aggregans]|uniref:Fic/DOC family protein n=1 Tax=Edaphobacter aggregans TaxID=570835 RepID=UPI00068E3F3E|nr:Fic family protein [Edaphobacter aggregans]